jgi:hypothetical protein
MAGFGRISWTDYNYRNTGKGGFILNKATQLMESPTLIQAFLLAGKLVKAFTYAFQVLQRNAFAFFFGKMYNLFCNGVIGKGLMSFLLSRKPFQKAFSPFRAFGLKRRPHLLPFNLVGIQFFGRKSLTVGKTDNIGNSEISLILQILFVYYIHEKVKKHT